MGGWVQQGEGLKAILMSKWLVLVSKLFQWAYGFISCEQVFGEQAAQELLFGLVLLNISLENSTYSEYHLILEAMLASVLMFRLRAFIFEMGVVSIK